MCRCSPLLVSYLILNTGAAFPVLKSNQYCRTTRIDVQRSEGISAQDIAIPIIYEDDNLLAICKPPHVPHHDDPQYSQMGIMSLIREQQSKKIFSYSGRLYGVHRLDRVTSGILLFAKDSTTANAIIDKFRKRDVKKYYFAISGKKPKKKKQGWVRGHMTIGRRGNYKLLNENKQVIDTIGDQEGDGESKRNNDRGGYAQTRFYTAGLGNLCLADAILNENESADGSSQCTTPKTAILFEPHTGKTHQLRVAAKSVGLPILGDERYGGGKVDVDDSIESDPSLFDRTYLHASAIHFEMNQGYNITICSTPQFGHLFSEENSFNTVFESMMNKYCDCLPILDALRAPSIG
jgi:tRNA pseudouridine32 synthase/23S rRNA pseudouridine746 synthase